MCETCGCGAEATLEDEHTHTLPDGTVIRHVHEHGHAHPGTHTHGGAQGGVSSERQREIALEAQILQKNALLAARNRGWFDGRGVFAVNVMSSPGSGKTTLLEKTLRALLEKGQSVVVLEGDQETTRDAERIRATGAPALQINTGKGCHLEADMVLRGTEALAPAAGSTLFIENVGNLVCPALFDLGEHARVVLFSVTEGEDKPLKYPHMFQIADLVLLTKTDLIPHLDFSLGAALDAIRNVQPKAQILEISARSGAGMDAWLTWLGARVASR